MAGTKREGLKNKSGSDRKSVLTNEELKLRYSDPLLFQKSLIKARIKELREDLPHLYGWKWYPWAREFFESRNRMNLLVAANQVSKSSTAIRKNIEWACNKKLWPELWSESDPRQFWYFYPSDDVATIEFEKKWVPEFLPRGDMKNHDCYGWDAEYSSGSIFAIHFRSGVTIYFKSYGQKSINLQTATVHMITFDEEAPEIIVDEILARLRAVRGYFNQVFTATQGYQLWYRAMECVGQAEETFPSAWKRCVSLRDSMYYTDGTCSKWTDERIREAEQSCTSPAEVLKRIDGRFIKDEGRKYLSFDADKNLIDSEVKVDKDWRYYAGVDIGSGGKGRSAGAIVIIGVAPDFCSGRVVRTWRGDHEETTARDILDHYKELRQGLNIIQACYDYQSREFGLIASRSGEPFVSADKSRNSGEQIINTLFSSGALLVDDGAYDNRKLVTELMSVPAGSKNRKFQDDLTDAMRYVIMLIPWDFSKISPNSKFSHEEEKDDAPKVEWTQAQHQEWEIKQRRGEMSDEFGIRDEWQSLSEELGMWNTAYGN